MTTEVLSATVNNHQLELVIKLRRVSSSGYPVYDLDCLVDGKQPYKFVYGDEEPLSDYKTARLTRRGLSLLEPWCKAHPCCYLTGFECELPVITFRILWDWGIRWDGRGDTWFTLINSEGERNIFPGVLNPIADCLDINDLWRVAKDYNYFLGDLQTPVDFLIGALNQTGYRNLLESGYSLPMDLSVCYRQYSDWFTVHKSRYLSFKKHPLDFTFPLDVIDFRPKNEPPENREFRFYVGQRLIASLKEDSLMIFSDALDKDLRNGEELTDPIREEVHGLAVKILSLNPSDDEVTYIKV